MKKLLVFTLILSLPLTAFSARNASRGAVSRSAISRTTTDTPTNIEINEDKFTEIYNNALRTSSSTGKTGNSAMSNAVKTALASKASESSDDFDYSDLVSCDETWRQCLQGSDVCGTNYILCTTLSPIEFSNRISVCPKKIGDCTVSNATVKEVINNKDDYMKVSKADSILECGETMSNCIMDICGKGFTKCAKSISVAKTNCGYIADECSRVDPALWVRTATALNFAKGQMNAEITKIENRMAEIESELRAECSKNNFAFDSSKMQCIGVVDFNAMGMVLQSKRMSAGSVGNCSDEFFGLDITTYRQNAANETIKQKTVSNTISGAMLGMGVGSLAGKYGGGLTDKLSGLKDKIPATGSEQEESDASSGGGGNAQPQQNDTTNTESKNNTSVEADYSKNINTTQDNFDKKIINNAINNPTDLNIKLSTSAFDNTLKKTAQQQNTKYKLF